MRRGWVVLAVLTLFLMPLCPLSVFEGVREDEARASSSLQGLFAGFEASTASDLWNQTPWVDVAVPGEFDLLTVLDYSDVGVLINNNSEASRTIGWAFVAARNISEDRVFVFNGSDVPTSETINRQAFQTHFEDPFRTMLLERNTSSSLNYLVTTKGIPLRVSGGNNKASFDQELSLVGGTYNSSIGEDWWDTHSYGPLSGGPMERFSRDEQGFFLVTRLTGYSVETALGLIEKANGSLGERGTHVLDLATNRNGSGYKFWNDDLYVANTTLNQSHGIDVLFDETSTFMTNVSNVMGYASWGSNDGSWSENFLPNQGFETADAATTSGRKFWEVSAGSPAAGETFAWTWSDVKRGGSGAMALEVVANCSQFSGDGTPGLHGEFFDNEGGVTIPSGAMPLLIDREPDHARVEADLDYGSSGQPYPGLDDRFKHNWGARFSGLVDVPWTDNWTFHLTSDDGTELWIDGQSVVTNYGMHGMVERTGWVDLDAGLHDLRVEFYQGGGPHGLKLAWSTSNLSKTPIPPSAFVVSEEWMPSNATLEHHWAFEDGSGTTAVDGVGEANLSAYGMNASNWRSCVDGGCLWFDGVDDYLDVDVDDWDGNFTVSQWVWANSTSLPNYATVFAVSDNAGANASFQHAAFSGEWRLHNNQTHAFGAIDAQRWMHLVTVFDAGEVRQYFDGVLVNTHQQPAGAVNEIERYRMGVNRAGSTYFEGMIDEVAVWSSALEDWEVTALNRAMLGTCQPLSVAGQGASVSQTFDVPEGLEDHAWLALAHGRRSGTAHGSFHVTVEGLDAQGTVLSTNTSSPRATTTSWESDVTRFRPDANTVQLRVTVTLDVVPTSVDGALHIDDVLLRAIRPSNGWVNGSIAETAVSTGGRSFAWGTAYGQSLVADLLEDGVSSVKGYVYEPYLTAVGSPSVLLDAYATGYSMAEAHAMANTQIGWMGVVVGDPKMAPYADRFHDVRLVDVRTVGNVTQGLNSTLELVVENHGMSAADGRIEIRDVQGSTLLASTQLMLPAGNLSGSRVLMPVNLSVDRSGWIDVQIRYVATDDHAEVATDDNLLLHRFWSNAPPEVLDVRCLGQSAYRGDTIICEVEAVDDLNVTDVRVMWSVRNDATNVTSSWEELVLGTTDGRVWWSSLSLPVDATVIPVGWLDIRAVAMDASQATTTVEVTDVMEILNAPSTWFGPHVAGVDATPWSGVTLPPGVPFNGLPRDATSEVTACVSDVDHDPLLEAPSLTVQRKDGSVLDVATVDLIGGVDLNPSLTCTAWNLTLPNGLPLEDLDLAVIVAEDERLRRRFTVDDTAPSVTLSLLDEQGLPLSRALGDGSERLHIVYDDADDAGTGAVGDLIVTWPGQAARVLPVQIEPDASPTVVALDAPINPLEEGQLRIEVDLSGAHGASVSTTLDRDVLLTPPTIELAVLCDERGEAEELRFGMEVWFGARVLSTRPLDETVVTIEQEGWRSTAPPWTEGETEASPSAACAAQVPDDEHARWFRLRPDRAFVNGEASVGLRATDIDGASSRTLLDLVLRHAPPEIGNVTVNSTGTAGDPVTLTAELLDLDGVLGVTCQLTVRDEAGGIVHDETVRVVAYTEEEAAMSATWLSLGTLNGTVVQTLRCVDVDMEVDTVEVPLNLAPANRTSADKPSDDPKEAESDGVPTWVLVMPLFLLVLLGTALAVRSRDEEGAEGTNDVRLDVADQDALWDQPEVSSTELKRPEGWTVEQYSAWLEGPRPEGWSEDAWKDFVEEQVPLNR